MFFSTCVAHSLRILIFLSFLSKKQSPGDLTKLNKHSNICLLLGILKDAAIVNLAPAKT